jgi:hypothetical protein
MKKLTLFTLMLMMGIFVAFAQGKAELKFEKTTHDFGTFSEEDPVVTYIFKFTNKGDAPLVIHQAVASCGCTVPEYTKEPIKPGAKGEIKVTYNGAGRFPGQFRKTITIHSNADNDLVRLYIKGDMTPKSLDLKEAVERAEKETAKINESVQEKK